jgi:hypothetical protein
MNKLIALDCTSMDGSASAMVTVYHTYLTTITYDALDMLLKFYPVRYCRWYSDSQREERIGAVSALGCLKTAVQCTSCSLNVAPVCRAEDVSVYYLVLIKQL